MTPTELTQKWSPLLKQLVSDLESLKREPYTITVGVRDLLPEALAGAQNTVTAMGFALESVEQAHTAAERSLKSGLVQGREDEKVS